MLLATFRLLNGIKEIDMWILVLWTLSCTGEVCEITGKETVSYPDGESCYIALNAWQESDPKLHLGLCREK